MFVHNRSFRAKTYNNNFCDFFYNAVTILDYTVLMTGLLVMIWGRFGDVSQNSLRAG
jgi:hypothetical protein